MEKIILFLFFVSTLMMILSTLPYEKTDNGEKSGNKTDNSFGFVPKFAKGFAYFLFAFGLTMLEILKSL